MFQDTGIQFSDTRSIQPGFQGPAHVETETVNAPCYTHCKVEPGIGTSITFNIQWHKCATTRIFFHRTENMKIYIVEKTVKERITTASLFTGKRSDLQQT